MCAVCCQHTHSSALPAQTINKRVKSVLVKNPPILSGPRRQIQPSRDKNTQQPGRNKLRTPSNHCPPQGYQPPQNLRCRLTHPWIKQHPHPAHHYHQGVCEREGTDTLEGDTPENTDLSNVGDTLGQTHRTPSRAQRGTEAGQATGGGAGMAAQSQQQRQATTLQSKDQSVNTTAWVCVTMDSPEKCTYRHPKPCHWLLNNGVKELMVQAGRELYHVPFNNVQKLNYETGVPCGVLQRLPRQGQQEGKADSCSPGIYGQNKFWDICTARQC